jgi:glycosyltransferase involved in cell wall biosynthesis
MRVCRISRNYPRDTRPGSGLNPYSLSGRVGAETLYVTKRFAGAYAAPPQNTRLAIYSYWEPRVPRRPGLLRIVWLTLAKGAAAAYFLVRAAPAIIRFRPDIVHLHSILTIILAPFTRLFIGALVALTFHGTDFIRFRRNRVLRWLVNRTVDVVFCVSRDMADQMAQLLGRPRVVAIPNGVDHEVFFDRGTGRVHQVIAVGHLKWQKGYEYLLHAMRLVTQAHPRIELLIAGEGALEKSLRDLAAELGISDNVCFLGLLSQPDLARLLSSSRVYVMTSVSEGFPKALLEALACGTPAVVTNVGECGTVAEGAGFVVPPRSPEAIAKAIVRLLEDDELFGTMSRNALERAQTFSWDEVARITESVYDLLLEQNPQPSSRSNAAAALMESELGRASSCR